jgi:hypothetical protein
VACLEPDAMRALNREISDIFHFGHEAIVAVYAETGRK